VNEMNLGRIFELKAGINEALCRYFIEKYGDEGDGEFG
jgi:hypothetical protein